MEERDWQILLILHEKKSITKAAEALFISQPTLTSRLQQIEARFEAQVVVRGKKGVRFTPEGEYLVECARDMLRSMHRIEGMLRTIRNEVKGTLRIGASNFFTRHKLPELLRQFHAVYPEVEFKVTTNLSGKIVEQVGNHDLDVGFIRGDYVWLDQKDVLFEENMYAVCAGEFEMADLPRLPRIDYISNKPVRDLVDNWWKQSFTVPPHVGMTVDNIDSCKEMVVKGLGYAFLPDGMLEETDEMHKVKMLDKTGRPLMRTTWMFYRADSLNVRLLKAFVEFVNSQDMKAL